MTSRASLVAGCALLAACGQLIDLDALQRVDCVDDCGAAAGGAVAAGGKSSGGSGTLPGGGSSVTPSGGKANGGSSSSGGVNSAGGANTAGAMTSAGGGGAPNQAGTGGTGATGDGGPCPGGPAPAATWQEHWQGHDQLLALRDYDSCVALYVDPDMSLPDSAWLTAFFDKAWTYNLKTYGDLGSERLFVVLHQNKYLGGHVSAFYETTHDGRNVLDAGASSWQDGDYDLAGTLLSALVERTAVAGKQGSPASAVWGAAGFAQIYKYDLYLGLGMNQEATQAFDAFTPIAQTYPAPGSYWFSDFYEPIWKAHGKTQLLTGFFALLAKYYPTKNNVMPAMTFGKYIHFMSGAAGTDVKTQATYAFGWNDTWEQQWQQARTEFPAISY